MRFQLQQKGGVLLPRSGQKNIIINNASASGDGTSDYNGESYREQARKVFSEVRRPVHVGLIGIEHIPFHALMRVTKCIAINIGSAPV